MDGRQIEAIVIIFSFFPSSFFFFLSLSFYPLLSFSEAARVGSFFSLLLFCPPSYPLIFLLHIIWFPSRSTCHSRWITAVLVWKLWVAHTHSHRQKTPPPTACSPPLSGYVFKYLRASDYHVWIVLVVKIHSHSPFVFSFFFSPPFLFSCAWGLSPRLNHPTTLDTNTRPSSKMPRHGINDKVTLAGAPAPPTLSWRLNCDKTPLFSPERRRRGYQKGGERGGGERKKR